MADGLDVKKADVEKLLERGLAVQIRPKGYSMYPMFNPGRDEAILKKADLDKVRRGDVALYRREDGMLVLHRVCRREGGFFYAVGDNQTEVEGPLRVEQIKGVLTAFIRNGRYTDVSNPFYRMAAGAWLFMRPARRPFQLSAAKIFAAARAAKNKLKLGARGAGGRRK